METYNLPIIIEHDSTGYFASCPSLQGCYTQGGTYEEALANIKDAINLHLADRAADEELPKGEEISVSTIAVTV